MEGNSELKMYIERWKRDLKEEREKEEQRRKKWKEEQEKRREERDLRWKEEQEKRREERDLRWKEEQEKRREERELRRKEEEERRKEAREKEELQRVHERKLREKEWQEKMETRERQWKEEKERWVRDFEGKLGKENSENLKKEKEEKEGEQEISIVDTILEIKNTLPHILEKMPGNIVDIPLYFECMENNFRTNNIDENIWVHLLLPLMSSKVKKIFFGCGFQANEMFVYQIVKKQILKILSYETSKYSLNSRYTNKMKLRIVKPLVAKFVRCELSVDECEVLRDVNRIDYFVVKPVMVKSCANSFVDVIVRNELEVFEKIEVVSHDVVCDYVGDNVNLIVDMISDEEANGCVSCIKDDAELMQIVKDDVAFVDVIEVIEVDCSVLLCDDVIGDISVEKMGQDIEVNDLSVVCDSVYGEKNLSVNMVKEEKVPICTSCIQRDAVACVDMEFGKVIEVDVGVLDEVVVVIGDKVIRDTFVVEIVPAIDDGDGIVLMLRFGNSVVDSCDFVKSIVTVKLGDNSLVKSFMWIVLRLMDEMFWVKNQVNSVVKWYRVFVRRVFDRGKLKLDGVNWIFIGYLD